MDVSHRDEEQQQLNGRRASTATTIRRRRKGATRFGDPDFTLSSIDEFDQAEWGEVYSSCCTNTLEECVKILGGVVGLCACTYFFLFGLDLLGTGAKVLSGCRGGVLFESSSINPISSVMLAALTTALLQSSSTTTGIVVALVSDKAVTVEQGIYMVMGANIGTTITNDIVSMAQFSNRDEFERAFGAACLHDVFNLLTVAVLLPFEALTGYLEVVTKLIVDGAETKKGDDWEGPMELYVKPLTRKLIMSNKKAILGVAEDQKECTDYYPTTCVDGLPQSKFTCHLGFVGCDDEGCPAWFKEGATLTHDQVAGGVSVAMALIVCYVCVFGMMAIAQWLLRGLTTRVVHKVVNVNGYFSIALGAGLTMLLQSSSLTTACLTPWVGIGVVRLEQMYPLTLGANIGTTLSSILSALVASGLDPLQVALAHLFFNITGVLLWYPIPHLRRLPIFLGRQLGKAVRVTRSFSIFYILFVYFLFPLIVLGISELMANDKEVAGSILIAGLSLVSVVSTYWCWCMGGGYKTADFIDKCRQRDRHSRHNAVAPAVESMDDNDFELNENQNVPSYDDEESM